MASSALCAREFSTSPVIADLGAECRNLSSASTGAMLCAKDCPAWRNGASFARLRSAQVVKRFLVRNATRRPASLKPVITPRTKKAHSRTPARRGLQPDALSLFFFFAAAPPPSPSVHLQPDGASARRWGIPTPLYDCLYKSMFINVRPACSATNLRPTSLPAP